MAKLVVRNASGNAVIDMTLWRRENEAFACEAGFVPGDYRVDASTPSGRRGEASFQVGEKTAGEPVRVELR
jgi:hypothetical protein